jgi:macrolide transport system ATP-binding/permease protein
MTSFFRKLCWLVHRRTKEAELREEIQFHIDEEAEQREAQGLAKEEAQRAGRRDLGNVGLVQEDTRAAWGWTLLERFLQDIRYAIRTMSANRLFTVAAVLSLALGIGANTAIYSFMDAVVLRPLPVRSPESLVVLNWQMPRPAGERRGLPRPVQSASGTIYPDPDSILRSGIFPYPAFEVLRTQDSALTLFAHGPAGNLNLAVQGQAEIVDGTYVTGAYFGGLGVFPAAGRLILAEDDRAGAAAIAVVSHAFGEKRFGNAAAAVGQPILLNNVPFTIVGVTPPGFFGADFSQDPEFFIPMRAGRLLRQTDGKEYLDGNYYWIQMMGRLRPGMTLAGVQSELAQRFHQWVETTATNDEERANLPKLVITEGAWGPDALRRQYSRQIYVLMILVGLILAVACANIANLLLARTTARSREIALRLSLGAGRFRVARQLLTESIVLSSFGGILGICVGIWGIRFLTRLLGSDSRVALPRADLNWQVLGLAIALSVVTGLLFGLAPAIRATRRDSMPALKTVRSSRAPSRLPLGLSDVLIVVQVAMSLLLVVAAGLFLKTLSNLKSIELGFNRENLLLFDVNARQAGYGDAQMASFYEEIYRRLREIPGVRNVSFSNRSLFTGGFSLGMIVDGKPVSSGFLYVGPEFFSTMGIPLLLGRGIGETERSGSRPVVVVSELFAKTYFGDENPLGRRVAVGRVGLSWFQEVEIVGVAKDVRSSGLKGELRPVVYGSHNQAAFQFVDRMTFELRTSGDPLVHVNAVRDIVRSVNSRVPVTNIVSQVDEINHTISREIMFARVCTAFAILALTIAFVGLYGTVSYNVARRTAEIGIRVALGAPRGNVIRMVLQKVMMLVLVALAIGLPFALMASQYVEAFLFAIKPRDPAVIAAAVGILLLAAALAAFVPARRASRVDPLVALRHE